MSMRLLRAGLPGLAITLAILLVPLDGSDAHEIVGNRLFPATLGIEDPGVNDELSFPTVAVFKTGDDPSFRQRDISGEFSKRITDAFGVSFGATHSRLSAPGGPTGMGADGFQNLETTFKYRLIKDPVHEFVMSVGLSVEWGRTGAQSVGAEQFNVYTPTVYFGKGFGDLPDTLSWIRPVAVTGQVGYAIPGRRSTPTAAIRPWTPNFIHACCSGAGRCNTACPTLSLLSLTSVCRISSIGLSRLLKRQCKRRWLILLHPAP
jgi:hypothetical protein